MKTRKGFRMISLLICGLLILSLAACGGGDQDTSGEGDGKQVIKLTIGAGHPYGSMPYVTAADDFFVSEISKRVEESTDYSIQWTTAYGGSVAKLAEVIGAVENGLLDVGLTWSGFEPSALLIHNINAYIPFNTPDAVQAIRVTSKLYDEFPDFKQVLEDRNQKFLGLGAVGNYQLLTTFPVNTLEDVKGVKVCAAGPNLTLLSGTGAIPIQGDLTEAYSSFDSGVYEGWIMYPASTYGFKLHEVAPYQTNLDFGAVAAALITINLDTWNGLPTEVQDIMTKVGKEYEAYAGEHANEANENGLNAMLDEGFTVTDFPFEEKEKWAAVLPNVPMDFAAEANSKGYPGTEIVTRYLELLVEEGYQLPRNWLE